MEEVVKAATKELREREQVRDEALVRARKARMLSKQAIQYLHNNQTNKALNNLSEASRLLDEVKNYSTSHGELTYFDQVESSRQEYAEASILYSLYEERAYPKPELLKVPYSDYLLGLADVPGELRRRALKCLQQGDIEKAEKSFEVMEEIYLHLTAMEEGSLLLKGMRRKMDIIRMVNEKTLADITNENSRIKLGEKLEELVKKLS